MQLEQSTFYAPGTPLPFERCENFRDLGGYVGAEGKRVKYGAFYRTPALAALKTPGDLALFESLGVRTVIDFRSAPERAAKPDPAFPGVTHYDASAMVDEHGNDVQFDPAAILAAGENALGTMLDVVSGSYRHMPFQNQAYRLLFRLIRQGAVPLLFHCTAGKDRTGVAAALILRALGVSRADILADYLATNTCRQKARAAFVHTYEAAKDLPDELIDAVVGVQAENLICSLNAIDAAYSCFEEYLAVECDFDAEALAAMRRDYLV